MFISVKSQERIVNYHIVWDPIERLIVEYCNLRSNEGLEGLPSIAHWDPRRIREIVVWVSLRSQERIAGLSFEFSLYFWFSFLLNFGLVSFSSIFGSDSTSVWFVASVVHINISKSASASTISSNSTVWHLQV